MKALVLAIAKALAGLKQREYQAAFERIATALAESKLKQTSAMSQALAGKGPSPLAEANDTLGSLLPVLGVFTELFQAAGAKKKNLEELQALIDLFSEYRNLSIDEFCLALCTGNIGRPAVDHHLVDTYLEKLEKALGDEQNFPMVFEALNADQRIAQPEAVELASRFLAPLAKSTSRPKALRRVLFRHEKLLESRAASSSIAAQR